MFSDVSKQPTKLNLCILN